MRLKPYGKSAPAAFILNNHTMTPFDADANDAILFKNYARATRAHFGHIIQNYLPPAITSVCVCVVCVQACVCMCVCVCVFVLCNV